MGNSNRNAEAQIQMGRFFKYIFGRYEWRIRAHKLVIISKEIKNENKKWIEIIIVQK